MSIEGGCFCGAVRYKADGEAAMTGLCHCRQCQTFSGGGSNHFMGMPASGFSYTKGTPKSFKRADAPVFVATREFCGDCGTQLVTRADPLPDVVFVKVGTLDDPSVFGTPQVAIFMSDKQPFHHVAEGIATFDKMPPL